MPRLHHLVGDQDEHSADDDPETQSRTHHHAPDPAAKNADSPSGFVIAGTASRCEATKIAALQDVTGMPRTKRRRSQGQPKLLVP